MKKGQCAVLVIFVLLAFTSEVRAQAPLPDDEFCYWDGWWDAGVGLFFQELVAYSDPFDWSGYDVTEDSSLVGQDDCWFNGSAYDPAVAVTGGTWTVVSNIWGDDFVGWTDVGVTYYRQQRAQRGLPVPCGNTVYQDMYMDVTGLWDWRYYKTNELRGSMGTTSVCSMRAGIRRCRLWP